MSGLQIFNAHPRLYWGDTGNEGGEVFPVDFRELVNETFKRGFHHVNTILGDIYK